MTTMNADHDHPDCSRCGHPYGEHHPGACEHGYTHEYGYDCDCSLEDYHPENYGDDDPE